MAQINANILATALFNLRSARMASDPHEALANIEEILNTYMTIAKEADGVTYLLSGYYPYADKHMEVTFYTKNEALHYKNEVLGVNWRRLEKISACGDIELIKEF